MDGEFVLILGPHKRLRTDSAIENWMKCTCLTRLNDQSN